MSFLNRVPKAENPDIPRGFEGRERALVAIVYAALRRANYKAHFLGADQEPAGQLHIGVIGGEENVITVSKSITDETITFRLPEAQRCAQQLNRVFSRAVGRDVNLASARQGRTAIGARTYAEVVVRRPKDGGLRALYNALVK